MVLQPGALGARSCNRRSRAPLRRSETRRSKSGKLAASPTLRIAPGRSRIRASRSPAASYDFRSGPYDNVIYPWWFSRSSWHRRAGGSRALCLGREADGIWDLLLQIGRQLADHINAADRLEVSDLLYADLRFSGRYGRRGGPSTRTGNRCKFAPLTERALAN